MAFTAMPARDSRLYEGMAATCHFYGIAVDDISTTDWLAALNEAEELRGAILDKRCAVAIVSPAAALVSAFVKARAQEIAARHGD